jgi:hypothetical protein
VGLAAGCGAVGVPWACLGWVLRGVCCVAAGGQTEEEKIRVDILENQVMDTRLQLVMLCYNPDFVSSSMHSMG